MIAADVTARSAEIVFKDRASLAFLHYLDGKSLSARGIDKLVDAVTVMKGKCIELGVDVLYLIATAALRAAENFEQIRAELLERTGLPVNLIDGRTEAYCDYIANRIYSSYERAALIDIGGASTEICDLSVDDRDKMISLDVGVFTLHKKFVEEIQPSEDTTISPGAGVLRRSLKPRPRKSGAGPRRKKRTFPRRRKANRSPRRQKAGKCPKRGKGALRRKSPKPRNDCEIRKKLF